MSEETIYQIKAEISTKIDSYIESLNSIKVAKEIANKVFAEYKGENVLNVRNVISEYIDELMR